MNFATLSTNQTGSGSITGGVVSLVLPFSFGCGRWSCQSSGMDVRYLREQSGGTETHNNPTSSPVYLKQ